MGEYVTDYYHNTYERIVMLEKKYGESEFSKELKNDMYMIRKSMGEHVMNVFGNVNGIVDKRNISDYKETMKNYIDTCLKGCNQVLRKIVRNEI